MTTLIVGCGYLGRFVATAILRDDPAARVYATTRSPAKAASLAHLGLEAIIADVTEPETLGRLPRADRIFYGVGYDRSSSAAREAVVVDGLDHLVRSLVVAGWSGRFVYASSTGVYGQTDGSWVDESSATEPSEVSGEIALRAEKVVRSAHFPSTILRFSGLYGPGRIIGKASLERGEVIVGDPDRWLNLVHIEDAATAVLCALDAPHPGPLYVVTDDEPLRRRDYYAIAAGRLHAPPPRFEPEGSPRPSGPDKRVRNALAKAELGLRLAYPDARRGLAGLLD